MHIGAAKQRVRGSRGAFGYAGVQVVVGVLMLTGALLGHGTRVQVVVGGSWLLLGAASLGLGSTSVDDDGIRPGMRARRLPWRQVEGAYWSTSRPGWLALRTSGRSRPVWVQDPGQVVAGRYRQATGRPIPTYGRVSASPAARNNSAPASPDGWDVGATGTRQP